MKPQRLKVVELKAIKEFFRKYAPKNCYPDLVKLFSYILWLQDEVLRLERELRERTELDLFKQPLPTPPKPQTPVIPGNLPQDRATRLRGILNDQRQLDVYLKIHPNLTKDDLVRELATLNTYGLEAKL